VGRAVRITGLNLDNQANSDFRYGCRGSDDLLPSPSFVAVNVKESALVHRRDRGQQGNTNIPRGDPGQDVFNRRRRRLTHLRKLNSGTRSRVKNPVSARGISVEGSVAVAAARLDQVSQ